MPSARRRSSRRCGRGGSTADFERGCTIHKTVPALRGDFDLTVTDVNGVTHRSMRDRIDFGWQQLPAPGLDREFGATVTGTFVPDVSGDWTFGFRVVGRATVTIDGEVTFDVVEPATGGSFFSYGGPELLATVPLEAGVPCRILIDYPRAPHAGWRGFTMGAEPPSSGDPIADAVRLAAAADVALVVVGTNDEWETESEDRTSMDLPGRPGRARRRGRGREPAGPWSCSTAVRRSRCRGSTRSRRCCRSGFPAGRSGSALVDVLSGDVEPGGRLPVTFPRALDRTPAAPFYPGDGVRSVYGEGLLVGYRWYHHAGVEPLFPFGHGLGYTTFDIAPVGLSGSPAVGVYVAADVVNTGGRPGSSVVQVYVDYEGHDLDVPRIRRFVAARKVFLMPGERATVTIEVTERMFSSWLDDGWRVATGPHRILVGSSSRSLGEVGTIVA